MNTLATQLDTISTATTSNDASTGTWYHGMISILAPMNTSTIARPYLSMWKRSATSTSRKYRARKPMMANRFDVKTMNGSVVMAKIAGIESTANTRSVTSIRISTRNSGVT